MNAPSLEQDYALFGLHLSSTPGEVRSAYLKALKKWHPDLFPPGEARDRATEKVRALNAAYGRIKSAPLRFVAKERIHEESESGSETSVRIEFSEERPRSWFSGWVDAHDRLAEKSPQIRGIAIIYLALLGTLLALTIWVILYDVDFGLTYRRENQLATFLLTACVLIPIHVTYVIDALRGRLDDDFSPIQGLWHTISKVTFVGLPFALAAWGLVLIANGHIAVAVLLASIWIVLLLLKRRLIAD